MAGPINPPVILRGTEGDNELIGDIPNTDELILGFGGDDEIEGAGGNDEIEGGLGFDIINTEDGSDLIFGGGDDDIINSGNGNDVIYGDSGPETEPLEDGGTANDTIDGEGGDDIILGEVGDDILTGGFGSDFLSGGDGLDIINSHAGRVGAVLEKDEMFGGLGSDTFNLFSNYDGGRRASRPARENRFTDNSFAVLRDFRISEGDVINLRDNVGGLNGYQFVSGNFGGRSAADTFITRYGNTVAVVLDTSARALQNGVGTIVGSVGNPVAVAPPVI
ncbi:MAG: calcium-binding protein [Elainella sp.]